VVPWQGSQLFHEWRISPLIWAYSDLAAQHQTCLAVIPLSTTSTGTRFCLPMRRPWVDWSADVTSPDKPMRIADKRSAVQHTSALPRRMETRTAVSGLVLAIARFLSALTPLLREIRRWPALARQASRSSSAALSRAVSTRPVISSGCALRSFSPTDLSCSVHGKSVPA
jgi:hypothetical protein